MNTISQHAASRIVELFAHDELLLAQSRAVGLSISASDELVDAIKSVDHPQALAVAASLQSSNLDTTLSESHAKVVGLKQNYDGVPVGSNPGQPETSKELEMLIHSLRLFHVGDWGSAENVFKAARFSDKDREYLQIEFNAILNLLQTGKL